MILIEIFTKIGNQLTLTSERWNHLVGRHPEMTDYLEDLGNILQKPDLIVENKHSPNINLYHKYYKEKGYYIVIVVEEEKGFIVTAYTSKEIKKGEIKWQK